MVTKKKSQPRKRAKAKKKTSKPWPNPTLVIFLILVAVMGYAGYWYWDTRLFPSGLKPEWVESVLIAADVDLDRHLKKDYQDDVERWRVTVSSTGEKDRVLSGLRHLAKSEGSRWRLQKQDNVYLAETARTDGVPLRVILVVEKKTPIARKGEGNKGKPASRDRTTAGTSVADAVADEGQPMIAIVIDDIGHKPIGLLKPILDLKYPITFAVLPFLSHSANNAIYFHQNQYEVILHMPMEPDDYPKNNPGKGAILSHFNEREIRSALDRALKDIPFVSGVNNHMGSKITANRALMRPILSEVKKRDLFFVDSRTNSITIAHRLASEMGLRTARRDIFLDSVESYDFAVGQLKKARKAADKNGVAIVIGHPYPTSLSALADELPKLDKLGYRFVFVSEVVAALSNHL